jgi:hypothetical protein
MKEDINKNLLDDLKNLPKISAPENFEEELWKKIYSQDEKKEFFWQRIFSSAKFIPATATLAAIIIIFFLVRSNANDYEDPFMIDPPVRNDIITVSNNDTNVSDLIEQKQKSEQLEINSDESFRKGLREKSENKITDSTVRDLKEQSKQTSEIQTESAPVINDVVNNGIQKEELNFLKRSLSDQEKQEIIELKKKIKYPDVPKTE